MTRRVLVTRPADQAPELDRLLHAAGIEAVCVPTVAIDTNSVSAELDAALESLDGAAWLVVTSQNGARAIAHRLAAGGGRIPPTTRVAAVGPATASVLTESGITVDHIPNEYLTVAIAAGLGELANRRVVLARADAATPQLRESLVARGARVEEVVAYRTIEGPATGRDALHAALQRNLDGIAFTSGSTVRGLLSLASAFDRVRALRLPAFCIGPVTADVARHSRFEVAAVATPHTAEALAASIAGHLKVAGA
jgi:uroporphyrinogen-III synthase